MIKEQLVEKYIRNSGNDLVCLYSSIDGNEHFSKDDCILVNRMVTKLRPADSARGLTLMISSQGGDLVQIMKLRETLRNKYENVTVYIPKIGKSSMTYLAMTGNLSYTRRAAHLSDFAPGPGSHKTSTAVIASLLDPIERGILHACEHHDKVSAIGKIVVKYFTQAPGGVHGKTINGEEFYSDFADYENVQVYNEDNFAFRELNQLNKLLENLTSSETTKIISFNKEFFAKENQTN